MEKVHFCLIHYSGTKGSLLPLADKRFQTFLFRRRQWLKYDELSSLVAEKSLNVCPEGDKSVENFSRFFFQTKCYNQFTDVSKIERAEKKAAERKDSLVPNSTDEELKSPEFD